MNEKQKSLFFEKLATVLSEKQLIKLILSNKKDKKSDLKSVIVTIVKLKAGFHLSFVYRNKTNDITKNYPFEEAENLIHKLLKDSFRNAELFGSDEYVTLFTNSKGKVRLKYKTVQQEKLQIFTHDKVKNRLIETEGNIYLRELKVTNANWKIRHEMTAKYKQINKYIELLSPFIKRFANEDTIHIADMGSGKGYLTFALYDYLTNVQKLNVNLTGVEFREELVLACNTIAEKSSFEHLSFVKGTIEKAELANLDVLIALHACDTATDEAIFRGIKANSSLIVCAPCCHKQIRKEFNVTNVLSNVVSHGILKERQAEIITDSLRALIMEENGYKTRIFEFISTDHTPKNLMIVGEKKMVTDDDKLKIRENIEAIKNLYGIKKHYLETLLNS